MSKNFETASGAEVIINEAPFEDAMNLKNAIIREIGNDKFQATFIDSTPAIYAAIWPCLLKCNYNGQKITKATFEEPKVREDYYEVINACVEENLRPFLKGLGSAFNLFKRASDTNTPPTK